MSAMPCICGMRIRVIDVLELLAAYCRVPSVRRPMP